MRAACFALLVAGIVSGCAADLTGRWRIGADTPIEEMAASAAELSVVEGDDVPLPEVAKACGHSTSPTGVVAAVRPGVGARLRALIWTTSESATMTAAYAMPSAVRFDLPLRLVALTGSLTPDETVLLATFLVTHRRASIKQKDPSHALARHWPSLWNAFVRTLCIEFVRSNASADKPVNVLSIKADLLALCRAIPGDDRDARLVFINAFIPAGAPDCTAQRKLDGSIVGADIDSQRNDVRAVISSIGRRFGITDYYGTDASSAAISADVTLFAVNARTADAAAWTLAEWEASGICNAAGERRRPRIGAVSFGGIVLSIDDAVGRPPTHRIVRVVSATAPARIAALSDGQPLFPDGVIARADLRLLTMADVSRIWWQQYSGMQYLHDVHPAACLPLH